MEIGSISDIINAVSTLGTLGVAGYALIKAPAWLNQKLDEECINLATKIHFIINFDISKLMLILKNDLYSASPNPFSSIVDEMLKPYNEETNGNYDFNKVILSRKCIQSFRNAYTRVASPELLQPLEKLNFDIDDKIQRLRFHGWKYKGEHQIVINGLRQHLKLLREIQIKTSNIFDDHTRHAITCEPKDLSVIDRNRLLKIEPTLKYIESEFNKTFKLVLRDIDHYTSLHGDFFDYFERVNKPPKRK